MANLTRHPAYGSHTLASLKNPVLCLQKFHPAFGVVPHPVSGTLSRQRHLYIVVERFAIRRGLSTILWHQPTDIERMPCIQSIVERLQDGSLALFVFHLSPLHLQERGHAESCLPLHHRSDKTEIVRLPMLVITICKCPRNSRVLSSIEVPKCRIPHRSPVISNQ